ncbi:AraC family transcriptional regulator [Georgenia yuyongxinii]|uniref:AraC family transcriptional regulator n=1 Tax=Georgenia yuyongxinii TaxID=2589797 RepID=UPI00143DC307|nr:helix-turn-helix transcriptional regulator [Georgenia yuyongxinii]
MAARVMDDHIARKVVVPLTPGRSAEWRAVAPPTSAPPVKGGGTASIRQPAVALGASSEMRTRRLDELRESVSHAATPHDVTLRGGDLDGVVSASQAAQTNVVFVRYGADVLVEAGPTGGRFVLTVPLGPMGVGTNAVERHFSSPFVLTPDRRTLMAPHPWEGALVIATSIARVRDHLGALAGIPPDGDLEFRWSSTAPSPLPPGYLDSTCRSVAETLFRSPALPDVAVRSLEQTLISAALLTLPHTHTGMLQNGSARVSTSHAEAARAWMAEYHGAAVTVPDVARSIGLSVRQLQTVTMERFGLTPTEMLRGIRLAEARRRLTGAGAELAATVAEAAHCAGFVHLGRFAQLYRSTYGETPHQSLATARKGSLPDDSSRNAVPSSEQVSPVHFPIY